MLRASSGSTSPPVDPGITVLVLGGWLRWEALSLVGPLGDGVFSRINVQKAFVGAAGFTIEAGLCDATEEEAQIKRSMVSAAREVFAIIDHTKWGRAAFATFCRTRDLTGVITDAHAPTDLVDAVRAHGIDVRAVGVEDGEAPDMALSAPNTVAYRRVRGRTSR